MTSRGPLTLAALASAAVPGLDPDTVEGVVPSGPGDPVEVAFVSDREHRRWVIRCPRTPAASAHIERSAALLALLSRRLTMPVPWVKGWVPLPEGGRAAVHTYLTGRLVNLEGIEPESTIAVGLGRAIAQLHNLDPRVYEEAGTPVYDAAAYRSRRLAELDRAAATGRVPTGLLTRWEQVLDDESLWAFSTTATHGALGSESVLATPDDGNDLDVKALLGWESAQVADPADDLAPLMVELDPQAFGTVYESYVHNRIERPDRHIQERARVVGQMQLVRGMMAAVAAGDDLGAEDHATELRRLDERLAQEDEASRAAPAAAVPATTPTGVTSTEAGSGSDGSAASAEKPAAPGPTETGPTAAEPAETEPTSAEPTEPGSAQAGPTQPEPEQPVPTDVVLADAPDDLASDDASVSSDSSASGVTSVSSDSDEAVQVEHPAEPTPVRLHAVPDSATGRAADTTDTADDSTTTPHAGDDPAASDDPAGADLSDTDVAEAPPSRRPKGNDHVTAEITPINDDDGDDVVPLRPR